MLERLVKSGFMQGRRDHILVSGGVYHQEFIAFERILILARNYYARFDKRLFVNFELPPQAGSLADEVRSRIGRADLSEQVNLSFRQVAPHGRGKDIQGIPSDIINPPPCIRIDQIVFDPDGAVRPCCGLNKENHGIVTGRFGQDRLKDLMKRIQNDPILQFLAKRPMSEIFAHVSTAKRKVGYTDLCDLCQHAIGDLEDREPLQATLFDQQKFYPFWFSLDAQGGVSPKLD